MRQYTLLIPFVLLIVLFHFLSAKMGGMFTNFSPMVALFFCGAVFWQQSRLLLPVAVISWFIAAPLVSTESGYSVSLGNIIIPLIGYLCAAALGFFLQQKSSWKLLTGALASGIIFHLLTNLAAFFTSPLYEKTWLGLSQALWSIPPGLDLPTSFFLRQTCLSSLLFTLFFILAARVPALGPITKAKAKLRTHTQS